LVKTIGGSSHTAEMEHLFTKSKPIIPVLKGDTSLYCDTGNEKQLVNLFCNGSQELSLVGQELLLVQLFIEIDTKPLKMDSYATQY